VGVLSGGASFDILACSRGAGFIGFQLTLLAYSCLSREKRVDQFHNPHQRALALRRCAGAQTQRD